MPWILWMLVVLSGGGGAFRADKFLVNGIDAARQMICGSNYSTGHGDANGGPMSDYEFVSNALVSPNLISIAASKAAAVVPQGSAGGTQGAFILTRSGNLNAVTVQLAVGGGAVPGTDYAALPATCTFPVGVNSITLPVKPLAGAQAAAGTRIVLSIQPSSRYQVAVSGSATVFLYSAPSALPPIAWSPRSDWINVKNVPYGAHGDGHHDDTHAIQAALNMASSKPNFPMTVYFPPGTYIISSELTANNTRSWKGMYGLAMVGSGCNTILQWRGARGGTMYFPNGAGRARYIGLTWNGANIAGYAISLSATTMKEDHVRIESDAFERFTGSAIYSYGGGDGVHDYASEVMVWNCLFSGCRTGMIVGSAEANDYDWTIEQDEFVNCGTGISVPTGKAIIFDDQFIHSGQCDITTRSQYSQRVRRCTSIGSAAFFATTGGIQRATNAQIIQDCHIDSWTSNAGAIQLGNPGPNQVLDCFFTNPPGGNPPIVMSCSAAYPGLLTVEGNYCPTISHLVNSSSTVALETIPCGTFGSNIASPYMSFLQTAPSVDGANILDVTEAPYHADRTGHMDSTAIIQAAINAAEAAGGGTIVYFPSGLYKISSTLAVTGSNFSIEGSGFRSQLYWCGVLGGTMMSVSNPQHIEVRQLIFKVVQGDLATVGLLETSTGASTFKLSGNDFFFFPESNPGAMGWDEAGIGVELRDLPAGAMTYLEQVGAPIIVDDCGPATILGNFVDWGRLIVKGPKYPKTGFTGIDYYVLCSNPAGYDILVDDNQDLAIGDCYEESGNNHLHANRGNGTGTGRISMEGVKQESVPGATFVRTDNYAGRIYYGPTWDENSAPMAIKQTGSNAVDLILAGSYWNTAPPTFSINSSCNLIQLQNYVSDAREERSALPNVTPAGWGHSVAEALDYLRQLGSVDMKVRFGTGNVIQNPAAALDAVNPSPYSTGGYAPAGWWESNTPGNASGVRDVTTVSGASPFGPESQSMLAVDTAGATQGSRLVFEQSPVALAAVQEGVLSFDFNLLTTGSSSDFWVSALSGTTPCCSIHLIRTVSGGQISALAGGRDTVLGAIEPGVWYRAHVAIQAPAKGRSQAFLYLTPWTASGPGPTLTYAIDGVPAASATGLGAVRMFETYSGESLAVQLDNITLISGDLLPVP